METITKLFIAAILVVCVSYTLAGTGTRQPVLVARASDAEDQECKDGETKKVSCNSCFCANGHWACTLIGCAEHTVGIEPAREKRQAECRNGQSRMQDCNRCVCANGRWACTLRACLKKRAAQECSQGQTKRLGCNQCRCVGGGWACTRKACS